MLPKSFVNNLQEIDQGRVVQAGPWAVFPNEAGPLQGRRATVASRSDRTGVLVWDGREKGGTPNIRVRC